MKETPTVLIIQSVVNNEHDDLINEYNGIKNVLELRGIKVSPFLYNDADEDGIIHDNSNLENMSLIGKVVGEIHNNDCVLFMPNWAVTDIDCNLIWNICMIKKVPTFFINSLSPCEIEHTIVSMINWKTNKPTLGCNNNICMED